MANKATEIGVGSEESVASEATEPTETGMEGNVAGALSYLLTILTGIVFYVIDDRPFVRFHAAQSIAFGGLFFAAWIVLVVAQTFLTALTFSGSFTGALVGGLVSLVLLVVGLVLAVGGFGAWLYMMYKTYQGKTPRMPIAAGIADKLV